MERVMCIRRLWAVIENNKHNSRDSNQILLNNKDHSCELWSGGDVCYLQFALFP